MLSRCHQDAQNSVYYPIQPEPPASATGVGVIEMGIIVLKVGVVIIVLAVGVVSSILPLLLAITSPSEPVVCLNRWRLPGGGYVSAINLGSYPNGRLHFSGRWIFLVAWVSTKQLQFSLKLRSKALVRVLTCSHSRFASCCSRSSALWCSTRSYSIARKCSSSARSSASLRCPSI